MTEDEAKTKWCPFVRTGLVSGSGGVAVNHSIDGDDPEAPFSVHEQTRCIGSGCMAWRRSGEIEWAATEMERIGNALRAVPPEGDGWQEANGISVDISHYRWRRIKPGTEGYCGLAGDP